MDTLQMIKAMRRRNYKVAISAFESQLGCSTVNLGSKLGFLKGFI